MLKKKIGSQVQLKKNKKTILIIWLFLISDNLLADNKLSISEVNRGKIMKDHKYLEERKSRV